MFDRSSADLLRLVVSPSREPDGRRAVSQRGLLFDVRLDGETDPLRVRVVLPFCDGARALLARAPELAGAMVTMRHAGAAHDSFVPSRLDAIAALSVEEGAAGLRLVRYRPYAGAHGVAVAPPTATSPAGAPTRADDKSAVLELTATADEGL